MNDGTKAHEIRPRKAKRLRFQVGGQTVFAKGVQHPGTRPDGFFDRGAEAADKALELEARGGVERIRRAVEG